MPNESSPILQRLQDLPENSVHTDSFHKIKVEVLYTTVLSLRKSLLRNYLIINAVS